MYVVILFNRTNLHFCFWIIYVDLTKSLEFFSFFDTFAFKWRKQLLLLRIHWKWRKLVTFSFYFAFETCFSYLFFLTTSIYSFCILVSNTLIMKFIKPSGWSFVDDEVLLLDCSVSIKDVWIIKVFEVGQTHFIKWQSVVLKLRKWYHDVLRVDVACHFFIFKIDINYK